MSEVRREPRIPPNEAPLLEADGKTMTKPWYRYFQGERGYSNNVNTGVNSLATAQIAAGANAAASVAAANAAASAAIAASGSTTTDYDTGSVSVSSATFTTVLTNTLNHGAGGGYTITATLAPEEVVSAAPLISTGSSFFGEWQIVENPNAHVLATGTFTVTHTLIIDQSLTFYENTITFGTALPSAVFYNDSETGAVTIELQLRRSSGSNTISGLYATILTQFA